jgi:hypothetical protein
MPIRVKIDFEFGDTAYLKDDPEQCAMSFVGFTGRPGSIKYILDYMGIEYEVYDFLVTKEPDLVKKFAPDKNNIDEDD